MQLEVEEMKTVEKEGSLQPLFPTNKPAASNCKLDEKRRDTVDDEDFNLNDLYAAL